MCYEMRSDGGEILAKNQTMTKKMKIMERLMSEFGAYYCANLTRNVIPGWICETASGKQYNANELLGFPRDMKLSEYWAYWGNRLPEQERENYFKFFDIAVLLQRYEAEEQEFCYTYWTENVFHQPMLAEQHIIPYRDEETGDVWAVIYIKDLTEEYHKEQRQKRLEQGQMELAKTLRSANKVNQEQTHQIQAMIDELEESAEQLDSERRYMSVLVRNYTLVYYVDLDENRTVILKMGAESNVARMENVQAGVPMEYDAHIQKFAAEFLEESRQEFQTKLSRAYMAQQLKNASRFSFRFFGRPNKSGKKNYEVRVLRVNPTAMDGKAIIVSQEIDDLVAAEQHHQMELDTERKFLNVLSRDFTSVFHVNLETDVATALKMGIRVNADLLRKQTREAFGYTQFMQAYCRQFVLPSNQKSFLEFMALDNLRTLLGNAPRAVFQYQCNPDPSWHEYFEIQIFRINEDVNDANILVAFRFIDDLVTAERQRQMELEKLLEQERMQNEVLQALGSIYHAIFKIDLQEDSYSQISCREEIRHFYNEDPIASRMLGAVCRNIVSAKHFERMQAFFDLSTLAQRLDDEDTVEAECVTKGGNWHRARFIVRRRNEDGRATHVLYLTQVINDEKHYEQQLIARAEYADYANRTKTEFVSQVAHDIRTPMNSIFGFLEIAQANLGNWEKVSYSLEKIRLSGEFLKDLVDDVLDVSRMEQGKMKFQPEEHDLPKLLSEFAEAMQNAKFNKKQSLHVDVHPMRYERVVVDSMRLRQIYTNLLTNAIKYTPDGGEISFTVYQEEIPGSDHVRLIATISDTGIGMSEEFMTKMFSKFERGTDTRINKVSGYGLGLTIVKQIVELMGGTIEAQSKLGQGTTFCVKLEVPYVQAPAAQVQLPEQDYGAICAGMNLLVAEDNELNREVITELLDMHHIRCQCAADGYLCVKQFRHAPEGTFDAILMDMQMPNMDGVEAARQIRMLDLPWAKTIPIIAMTANALKEDVEKCLDAGMNAHMSKPVDVQLLMKTLAQFKG